jgi:HD-like signal output (HDOD) protein
MSRYPGAVIIGQQDSQPGISFAETGKRDMMVSLMQSTIATRHLTDPSDQSRPHGPGVPMNKRILFVDDEPMILQGLQRMLRSMRDEWDMEFVEGGEKALAAMAERKFDVIVTDMRMPVMNGAQLLAEVRKRHPKTVRLILSGHADNDLVVQCLGVAHQYISKPCDPEQLKSMVRSACLLGGDQVTDRVKEILGSIDRLPTMPAVYQKLEKALADPDVSVQILGGIIQQDMGMTAKILKIVNSAFFGLRRNIASPVEAVTYLGIDMVKALVLVNSIFERAEPLGTRRLALDDLWRHSMDTAAAAKAICQAEGASRSVAEEAFVAAILEDVGILVLAANFPKAYDRIIENLTEGEASLVTAEKEEFAVAHGEVGAHLLGLWGIPAPVQEIVAAHHFPQLTTVPGFSPLLAVYAADILVGELGGHPLFRSGRFDLAAMTRLGLADRVADWRSVVRNLQSGEGGDHHG